MSVIISRTLIDLLVALEMSDEGSVSVDAAAAFAEDASTALESLPDSDREELIEVIFQMAEATHEEERRQILLGLPEGLGLVE